MRKTLFFILYSLFFVPPAFASGLVSPLNPKSLPDDIPYREICAVVKQSLIERGLDIEIPAYLGGMESFVRGVDCENGESGYVIQTTLLAGNEPARNASLSPNLFDEALYRIQAYRQEQINRAQADGLKRWLGQAVSYRQYDRQELGVYGERVLWSECFVFNETGVCLYGEQLNDGRIFSVECQFSDTAALLAPTCKAEVINEKQ